ncbi:MAG TPA: amidohydrolase family protein [Candidatus Limnocylindria bacterium]|nr:amidohydrolase family protein [Candidatus Limnocylindria bacterium]
MSNAGSDRPRLILGGWLFDGIGPPVADAAVLVVGRVVSAAGRREVVGAPPDAELIDLGDRSILPGLIDAHLHFQGFRRGGAVWPDAAVDAIRATAEARRVLESGFTTVRDCGSANGVALRVAIEEGSVVGPRILAAGPPITQTGGHADWHDTPYELMSLLTAHTIVADGVDACRQAVRRVLRGGADLVKICATGGVGSPRTHMLDEHFTVDEIRTMVEEAHRAGKPVAAHAQGKTGALMAIRASVDTIEHGYFIDDECIEAMLRHGTALVPTFGLIRFFRRSLDDPGGLPAWRVDKQRECIEAMAASFPRAAAAGVPIATGSDTYGIAGRELGTGSEELVAMVQDGGVEASIVLGWATSGGARVLGVADRVGALAPGLEADLIAVDGRPWEDIETIRRVEFVMSGGRTVHAVPAVTAAT